MTMLSNDNLLRREVVILTVALPRFEPTKIPVFGYYFTVISTKIPVNNLGNFPGKWGMIWVWVLGNSLNRQQVEKFPCIFPVKQGNLMETGSLQTASTATLRLRLRSVRLLLAQMLNHLGQFHHIGVFVMQIEEAYFVGNLRAVKHTFFDDRDMETV